MKKRSVLLIRCFSIFATTGLVFMAGPFSDRSSRGQDPQQIIKIAGEDDLDRLEDQELARQAFRENCLMCHGEELVTHQRLTPKQWNTEVEKMIGWGSPLPPDRKTVLIDYLAASYPVTQSKPAIERLDSSISLDLSTEKLKPVSAGEARPEDLSRGRSLFAEHCSACHGPLAQGGEIGINLINRPILLHARDFSDLMGRGQRRMPSFSAVIDASQRDDLLAWLRAQCR